jgi:ABC-2 type transport system permease protein
MSFLLIESEVMVARCLRRSLRDPEAFFTALTLPVILLLLFVYVFGGTIAHGGNYANYVVPGLIVLCAGFGAGTTAVAVAADTANGIVDRFRSLPIAPATVLIGQVVASLVRNLTATVLVIGAGLVVGWRPSATPLQWLGAAGMIILLILAMSWLAAAVGLLARGPEAASSFTIVLMFLPYVSTAFVQARTMPAVLRGFASHQPFTPVIETIRGLWMGHTSTGASTAHEALIAVAWTLVLLAIGIAVASWRFARNP